jgi:hypothetical protein
MFPNKYSTMHSPSGMTPLQQLIKRGENRGTAMAMVMRTGLSFSLKADESSFIMVTFHMLISRLPCFDSIQTLMLLAQSHNFEGGHLEACIGGATYGFPVTVHVQTVKVCLFV